MTNTNNISNIQSVFSRLNAIRQRVAGDTTILRDEKNTAKLGMARAAQKIAGMVEESYTRKYMYCECLKNTYEAKFELSDEVRLSLYAMKGSTRASVAHQAAVMCVCSLLMIVECVQIQYEAFCALEEFNSAKEELDGLVSYFNGMRQNKDLRLYIKSLLSPDSIDLLDVYDDLLTFVEALDKALYSQM